MKDNFKTLDITTPKEGLVVYKNSYWCCVDSDPTKALFYGNSPQCNNNKQISEHPLRDYPYPKRFENVDVVFVETAFVPNRN